MRKLSVVLLAFVCALPILSAQQCVQGNCENGQGTMVYASGAKYIGTFRDGKIEGQGILYFSNGDKYIGDWQNQYRQGKGRLVFKSGGEYFGDFVENQLQGVGTMEYKNGNRYSGEWLNGKPDGRGTFVLANGDQYEGELQMGAFHGYGKMKYKDGTIFEGNWQAGKRHGKGVLVTALGDVVEDEWIEGKLASEVFGYKKDEVVSNIENAIETTIDQSAEVKIWAVIVGVGSYEHMPSLRFTDDDAYQLYAFLKSPEGGALPDQQLRVLIDENATYRNILYTIRRVLHQADDNDVVLFYFSGHGFESSFLPVDYDGSKNELRHEEIRALVNSSRAKHKIVIADACHAGGYQNFRSTNIDVTLNRYYQAFQSAEGGTALLLSSKEKEYSLEDGGLRSGVFSYFIIRGLKGEADANLDKIITISELFDFVKDNVRYYTANMQTPLLVGDYDPGMPVAVVR